MNHMVMWFISRLLVYLAISIGCGALTIIGAGSVRHDVKIGSGQWICLKTRAQ